ncbi:hypothetical protein NIES4071_95080 [Calothrix sp. NIES-4071]|nr:hypothetical protein NIES4071_95080 [Calothrix sp. NIES-4071]BAZ63773.1 hypothetical protein NIES4105_95010 [Calothrix sp. NIES-4105]
MTPTELLKSSKILDSHIKHNLLAQNEKLEHIIHSQNQDESINTTLGKIEIVIKKTIESSNFTQKHQQLQQVSHLCLLAKELLEKQNINELLNIIEQIDYLNKLLAVYTEIYQGLDLIFTAEHEIDLIEKFNKYILGYENFATIIEKGQFLTFDICRAIEMAVNAGLRIELEERNKEENISIPNFLKTAARLKRTLISTLWYLDKIKEDEKIEGYKNGKELAPYLKHMGRTPEEQLQKNQGAMKLVRSWLDEKVSPEESKKRSLHFELFKQIVDNERPPGHKLYSEE